MGFFHSLNDSFAHYHVVEGKRGQIDSDIGYQLSTLDGEFDAIDCFKDWGSIRRDSDNRQSLPRILDFSSKAQ